MEMTEKLEEAMNRLNDEQREAVEHLDGPLLVIAGPGTGKTQLLSLRAANILVNRPVRPDNILCLTFTNPGAATMRERIMRYVGREGFGIEVHTFHSFTEQLANRHPECFDRPVGAVPASDLQKMKAMNDVLVSLSSDETLYSSAWNGIHWMVGRAIGFVGHLKKSGLSVADLRRIVDQTKATIDYLEQETGIIPIVSRRIPSGVEGKEELVSDFVAAVDDAFERADPRLREEVAYAPSSYRPFLVHFHRRVHEKIPEGYMAGTTGYTKIRGEFFSGVMKYGMYFTDRELNSKLGSMTDIVERYERRLGELALYDYDDMLNDAIRAIESNDRLRDELREQYRYVQVDEFQDTNDAQMHLVELIVGEPENRPNVMAVGDDDQAIMKFQGASVDGIQAFEKRYDPAEVVLRTNYRSVPALVELSNRIGSGISDRLETVADEKWLSSDREDDGLEHFRCVSYEAPQVEYHEIARELRDRTAAWEGEDHPTIAVIARKNATLQSLVPHLARYGVPFSYEVTSNVFALAPMQAFLATLRFVDAYARFNLDAAKAELPRIIASEEIGLLPGPLFEFAVHANGKHGGDWLAAMEDYEDGKLRRLRELLIRFSP